MPNTINHINAGAHSGAITSHHETEITEVSLSAAINAEPAMSVQMIITTA